VPRFRRRARPVLPHPLPCLVPSSSRPLTFRPPTAPTNEHFHRSARLRLRNRIARATLFCPRVRGTPPRAPPVYEPQHQQSSARHLRCNDSSSYARSTYLRIIRTALRMCTPCCPWPRSRTNSTVFRRAVDAAPVVRAPAPLTPTLRHPTSGPAASTSGLPWRCLHLPHPRPLLSYRPSRRLRAAAGET
jgi:hypothetical protein